MSKPENNPKVAAAADPDDEPDEWYGVDLNNFALNTKLLSAGTSEFSALAVPVSRHRQM